MSTREARFHTGWRGLDTTAGVPAGTTSCQVCMINPKLCESVYLLSVCVKNEVLCELAILDTKLIF